jgi:hypothetical protein
MIVIATAAIKNTGISWPLTVNWVTAAKIINGTGKHSSHAALLPDRLLQKTQLAEI